MLMGDGQVEADVVRPRAARDSPVATASQLLHQRSRAADHRGRCTVQFQKGDRIVRGAGTFGQPIVEGDPDTLIISVAVLVVVAGLAASVPAWRAARIDPAVVLREG